MVCSPFALDSSPTPLCARCTEASVIKQGHQYFCAKHYRFGQMRCHAKRHGKTVPPHSWFEERVARSGLACDDCNREMVWRSKESQVLVVSLQHYRDGSFGLVCRSCNTRHGMMEDDSFRDLPPNHKRCCDCKTVKPFSDFYRNTSRSGELQLCSACKPCLTAQGTARRQLHRLEYNAYMRNRRAALKAEAE